MSARAHLSTYARTIVPDSADRDPHDFYPTPPGATRALLSVEQFTGRVWEPACGDGAMANVLQTAGLSVYASDLIDRGFGEGGIDFLKAEKSPGCAHVITNPPFKHAQAFAQRALDLVGGKVALLCRLMWLEGKSRAAWMGAAPLARVWVFADRVPFQRGRLVAAGEQGGRMVPYAWFVFDRSHQGAPQLGWVRYQQDWLS